MRPLLLCLALLFLVPSPTHAQVADRESATKAPPNHTLFRRSFGGAYFIPNDLSKQYEDLKTRVEQLRESLDSDESNEAAVAEVARLSKTLEELQTKITEKEVFVSPVKIYEQTDTYEFELGKEPQVVIVADQIRLSSWDGPGIRCVLKKSIIAKEKPAAAEFEKLFVEHELKVPKELVGETIAERKVRTEAYFASEQGQAATEKQRAWRRNFEQEITDSQAKYTAFQGQPAHILQVRGLDNGERQWVSIELHSEGGTGSSGGEWDRRAELTIQLPRNAITAVLGCQVGVHVEGYEGSLLLTTANSTDRDYEGIFTVTGVKGDFAAYGVPLQSITQINGSVTLDGNSVMRNGGTSHSNGNRRMTRDLSGETVIHEIEGNLTARYAYTRLKVADVSGTINIENRYGPTQIEFHEIVPIDAASRIITESGTIRVRMPKSVLSLLPWALFTEVGEVQVNVDRELLEDISFSSSNQSWNGMITPRKKDDPGAFMTAFERPRKTLNDETRSPGFDVISRAGRIVLEAADGAKK